MARMHELAVSASPPYERVPNILRYTFNNLFTIYPLREPVTNHRALGGNSKISVSNDTLPLDSTY